MSNTKEVAGEWRLPYDWPNRMSEKDAALIARVFLAPTGLELHQKLEGLFPNNHGGKLTVHRVSIHGIEALPWPYLDRIADAFHRVARRTWREEEVPCGVVIRPTARDLDDPGEPAEFGHAKYITIGDTKAEPDPFGGGPVTLHLAR